MDRHARQETASELRSGCIRWANNAQVQNLVQKGGKSSYTFQYDDLYQLTAATGEWGKPRIAANKFTLSMSYDVSIRRRPQGERLVHAA